MRKESAVERRFWTFWLSGILLLAAQIVMNVWLVTEAAPLGISDHQAAGSAARVDVIHASWVASDVMDLAIYSMELDLLFIAVYAWGAQLIQAAFTGGHDMLSGVAATARPIKLILFLVTFFGVLIGLAIRSWKSRTT
jgi:hypothetical protein